MIREPDLAARIERLEELAQGLCNEVKLWKGGCELLEFGERRTYLHGLQDAIAGADAARALLVKVLDRLAEQERRMEAMRAEIAGRKEGGR